MVASPTTDETDVPAAQSAGVLIYDSDCGFCTASAAWFAEHTRGAASVAPWQTLDLDEYGLTLDDVSTASFWVADGQDPLRGAAGIAAALRFADRPSLRFAGRLIALPVVSWLARGVYAVIARHRHRMPGGTDACRIG